MQLKRPSTEDLLHVAEVNHLHLTAEEERAYLELFAAFLPRFDELAALPEPEPPALAERRWWQPLAGENPFNAIVRRCAVGGAGPGKLAGKRIGLKDNICVAGIEMTLGSTVIEGYEPRRDATLVERLLAAGGEIVAILNMDAFAYSGAGDTSLNGPTLNPLDPSRTAGGSSGGSAAALYHDDIDITFGADQGGSIRIPASWCGVVGLKPTHGLVPYTGIVGIDLTYDHVGPLARSVAEVALALEAVAGKDPLDPRQEDIRVEPYTRDLERGIAGLRIGLLKEGFDLPGAETDVEQSVREAVSRLQAKGASVIDIGIPQHLTAGAIAWGLFAEAVAAILQANGIGYHWRGIYDPELAIAFGEGLQARADELPPQGKLEAMLGTYLRERYHGRLYAKAQNQRIGLRQAYDEALRGVDLLAMPTTPMTAQPYRADLSIVDRVMTGWSMLGNTAGFNMTGHPSISVPCGTSNGLPIGLMLTGRHFEDGVVLRAARAVEEQTA